MSDMSEKHGIAVLDAMNTNDAHTLIKKTEGPCVSAYMPTQPKGEETRQNPIRFKNLLDDIKAETENSRRFDTADQLDLRPFTSLVGLDPFWQHQKEGLALFLSPEFVRVYRLPLNFSQTVVLSNRFYLKPVLPLFVYDTRFYILAFSLNEIRFFRCTRQSVEEMTLENLPEGLTDALKYDDHEKQLQMRSGDSGKGEALFHGQGVSHDEDKNRKIRYCRSVNKSVTSFLAPGDGYLILAGVDYLQQLYKEVNSYPDLLDTGISGNPEPMSGNELHAAAWDIVKPLTREGLERATRQFHDLKGTGKTSADPAHIPREAVAGRIESLMIPGDETRWGIYHHETGEVEIHDEKMPDDEDLLDFAAFYTIRNGGSVYPVSRDEMPDNSDAAAVFRF